MGPLCAFPAPCMTAYTHEYMYICVSRHAVIHVLPPHRWYIWVTVVPRLHQSMFARHTQTLWPEWTFNLFYNSDSAQRQYA